MTWLEIEAQWSELAGQAQSKWAKLSDHDLTFVGGNRDRLIGKLAERYGLPKEDGQQHVDEWSNFEVQSRQAAPERGTKL